MSERNDYGSLPSEPSYDTSDMRPQFSNGWWEDYEPAQMIADLNRNKLPHWARERIVFFIEHHMECEGRG